MTPILDDLRTVPAQAVRALEGTSNPTSADETFDATYYQYERYRNPTERRHLLSAYYSVKPWIPRSVQLRLRRWYAPRQASQTFPAWPVEPILVAQHHAELQRALRDSAADRVPIVGFWPSGYNSACILTHDVESELGVENIDRVREVERRYGLYSSWNFVAEDYAIPAGTFDRLREDGCEVGLHGIHHDGRLFRTRAQFEADLPKIRAYLDDWGAVGFRSPATHRRADWMHELGCLYDSSFPDTDPFEPQAGGCCSIFPFMFGGVAELPITLVQDHTLWEILGQRSIDLWLRKSEWIVRNHGLVNLITHPDYLTTPERLTMYEEFLAVLADQHQCWHALPRDVAAWWLARRKMRCEPSSHGTQLVGDVDGRGTVMFAREVDGQIVIEPR